MPDIAPSGTCEGIRWRCQNCGDIIDPATSINSEVLDEVMPERQGHQFFEPFSDDEAAWDELATCLRALIDAEDKTTPLMDEELAMQLSLSGFDVSTIAVEKYRRILCIPDDVDRRTNSIG